jgi:hypothetical protein
MRRAQSLRITRLDDCGVPVEGETGTLVTGFVSVTPTPNYLDPEELQQTDSNGDLCIDDRGPVQLRWIDLSIILCVTDPFFVNMVTGDPLVVDDATPTANTVGWRIDAELTGSANFALEMWSGVGGQGCDPSGFAKYGYQLFPWVRDAQWGEWVVGNNALTTTFTARAVWGGGWGVGPYDIRRDATTPATTEPLLTPIGPTQVFHFQSTTLEPPTAACGAVPLVIP